MLYMQRSNNTYNGRKAYIIYYFSVRTHPSYYLYIYSEGFVLSISNCREDIRMFIVDQRGIQDKESNTNSNEADEKLVGE
jgi:hypothetical protein